MGNAANLEAQTRAPGELGDIERVSGALKTFDASLRAGENQNLGVQEVITGAVDYKILAANTADQICGAIGGVGDYLEDIVLSVAAAGTLTIKDGSTTLFTFVWAAAVATAPVTVSVRRRSLNGGWKISTGASMTGHAGGVFS